MRQMRKRIPDKWKTGLIGKESFEIEAFWVKRGLCLKQFIRSLLEFCDSQVDDAPEMWGMGVVPQSRQEVG